jgi:hypothetical protein
MAAGAVDGRGWARPMARAGQRPTKDSMRTMTFQESRGVDEGLRSFASRLPEPAELGGTERVSAGFDRAEALERVAVRRQHLGFRSPLSYFHNGFAADLDAVVEFYNTRFNLQLSKQERSDLVAFLGTL